MPAPGPMTQPARARSARSLSSISSSTGTLSLNSRTCRPARQRLVRLQGGVVAGHRDHGDVAAGLPRRAPRRACGPARSAAPAARRRPRAANIAVLARPRGRRGDASSRLRAHREEQVVRAGPGQVVGRRSPRARASPGSPAWPSPPPPSRRPSTARIARVPASWTTESRYVSGTAGPRGSCSARTAAPMPHAAGASVEPRRSGCRRPGCDGAATRRRSSAVVITAVLAALAGGSARRRGPSAPCCPSGTGRRPGAASPRRPSSRGSARCLRRAEVEHDLRRRR